MPDLPTFLEAIAAWDERHYFPISDRRTGLDTAIPAGVSSRAGGEVRGTKQATGIDVRREARGRSRECAGRGETVWLKAVDAVRRACSTPPEPAGATEGRFQAATGRASRRRPGLVLADPDERDDRGRRRAGRGALSTAHSPGGFPPATRCPGCGRKHPAVR